jgi:replicative DNA helicase
VYNFTKIISEASMERTLIKKGKTPIAKKAPVRKPAKRSHKKKVVKPAVSVNGMDLVALERTLEANMKDIRKQMGDIRSIANKKAKDKKQVVKREQKIFFGLYKNVHYDYI